MLATSKSVLFQVIPTGHNHLLTTGTDDSDTLIIAQAPARVIIKVKGHQYRWLASGNRTFLEVASMMVRSTWGIVAFLCSVRELLFI